MIALRVHGNPLKVLLVSYYNYLFWCHVSINESATGLVLLQCTFIYILKYEARHELVVGPCRLVLRLDGAVQGGWW